MLKAFGDDDASSMSFVSFFFLAIWPPIVTLAGAQLNEQFLFTIFVIFIIVIFNYPINKFAVFIVIAERHNLLIIPKKNARFFRGQ